MKKLIIAAAAASLMLTGCGQSDADRCASASNPTECMAWSDAGGDVEDYLIGGMAGYMLGSVMSGGSRQTVIVQNPSYRGPYRTLRKPIPSRDYQVRALQKKVDRQRVELRRQQEANARKKAEIRSLKSSSRYSPSRSSYSSRSSFSSSRSSRRR